MMAAGCPLVPAEAGIPRRYVATHGRGRYRQRVGQCRGADEHEGHGNGIDECVKSDEGLALTFGAW